jgi:hypothetical protein
LSLKNGMEWSWIQKLSGVGLSVKLEIENFSMTTVYKMRVKFLSALTVNDKSLTLLIISYN